jgi:hypothetical protein
MNDLKTPVARLARLFRDARDRWKAKALERQKRLRAAQVRIRDLEHSRAYWKERALAAEGRAPASDCSAAHRRRCSSRSSSACRCRRPRDDDARGCPRRPAFFSDWPATVTFYANCMRR